MFYFQSGQLGHSTNTIIILKSNEHKSYAWVFSVICTFQSSKFFERLSMHSGVYHIRASALTPQLIAILESNSTHAPPVGNGIGEPPLLLSAYLILLWFHKISNFDSSVKLYLINLICELKRALYGIKCVLRIF